MEKRFARILKTFGFMLANLLLAVPLQAADSRLVIVLDASNSMWGQIDTTPKITLARSGLETLLAQQPANASIGLITYGDQRKSTCQDITVVAKPGALDTPTLLQRINGIAPYGRSPISAALEQAASLLPAGGHILLVSDGPESCQANPCVAAARLKAANPALQIHVLSFEDKRDTNSLRCVADSGGGQFTLIQDVAQLAEYLRQTAPASPPAQANQPAAADNTPGTLLLSAGASGSTEKLPASFLIYTASGDHVTSFTARTEVSQPLPPGDYRVNLLWRTTRLEKNLTIPAGQTITQHFDLGPMGKLRLSAQGTQQQAVEANFTLYSPTGDYLAGHLLKSVLNETLPVGNYRIKASLAEESQEAQLAISADTETAHVFQFRQGQ